MPRGACTLALRAYVRCMDARVRVRVCGHVVLRTLVSVCVRACMRACVRDRLRVDARGTVCAACE